MGSHEVNSLYGGLSKDDFEILEKAKNNFQIAMNSISLIQIWYFYFTFQDMN